MINHDYPIYINGKPFDQVEVSHQVDIPQMLAYIYHTWILWVMGCLPSTGAGFLSS